MTQLLTMTTTHKFPPQPDEAGEWRIHVTYDGEDIENSPFKCMVFDPRAIHVRRPSNDGSI